jgi:hypothetical protein
MSSRDLPPVVGRFEQSPKVSFKEVPPFEGFRRAFEAAVNNAAREWGPQERVPAAIELAVEITVWNPGGVGAYQVTINPL